MIPPPNLKKEIVELIESNTRKIAEDLDVKGLINVQYAVKDDEVYVIEANPRASRTVPFVAKATGIPLAKIASRVMMNTSLKKLREEGFIQEPVKGDHISVKEAVLPFNRFPEADPVLGPEMRSTGEVMGIDLTPGLAFAKSQIAAGGALPTEGTVFMSLADRDKFRLRSSKRIFETWFGNSSHRRNSSLFRRKWSKRCSPSSEDRRRRN